MDFNDIVDSISVKPYYLDREAGQVIYCSDCRSVLPLLPDKSIDLVLTDPPYGVEMGNKNYPAGSQHGLVRGKYQSYEDTYENFKAIIVPSLSMSLDKAKRGMVFVSAHRLQDIPRFTSLGGIYCSAASARDCWGFTTFLPIALYGHDPTIAKGSRTKVFVSNSIAEENGHPCPKPPDWILWCVVRGSESNDLILDPFLGSGTTAYCAKKLGGKCIGVEIEERYCRIAAQRCAQMVLPLESEQVKQGQGTSESLMFSGMASPTKSDKVRGKVSTSNILKETDRE